MERLYELLSEQLKGVKRYTASTAHLCQLMDVFIKHAPPFDIHHITKENSFHIILTLQDQPFELIQLYTDDEGTAFLNVSPPDENNTVDLQLIVLDELILFLTHGVNP